MSVIDYILDIFDAISTRKDKKEYIKKIRRIYWFWRRINSETEKT